MLDQSLPENNILKSEQDRLKKLRDYEILDTAPETAFDNIANLAAQIFDSNNAFVSFVDEDRVFFKANIGKNNYSELKRNESFCPLAILKNEVTYFEDITLLPTLNNLDKTSNDIRFYAGAPLITSDGYRLGTVGVTDIKPQKPSQKQLDMLAMLANVVMEKLEFRIAVRKTMRAQDDRLHMLIHDLKNPMTTISLQSELIGRMPNIDNRVTMIAGKINQQAKRMVDNLNEILSSARKHSGSFKPQKVKIDLKEILLQVVKELELTYKIKNQSININIEKPLEIFGDPAKLNVLFFQLLHNAIKFSKANTSINIGYEFEENQIKIAIKDNGVGLSQEDLDHLFIKFSRLSAIPTDAENSYGLGLITVKMMVDLHKGKVWAESEGKNKGTSFFVELPIK